MRSGTGGHTAVLKHVLYRANRTFLAVLLSCLFVSLTVAEEPNRFNIDFSGDWELDYQLSDHPDEKIRWQYVQARSKAEKLAERARNQGRMVDPQVFNVQSIVGLGRLAEKIAGATVLKIEQGDSHVIVGRNDDFSLVCDFNDLGWKEHAFGAEGCEWQSDQLVFRTILPDGLKVSHRLSLAADRSRLNVATTVTIDSVRYPFTLNRVYMPYEPGEGLYNCEFTVAKQTTCTLKGNTDS